MIRKLRIICHPQVLLSILLLVSILLSACSVSPSRQTTPSPSTSSSSAPKAGTTTTNPQPSSGQSSAAATGQPWSAPSIPGTIGFATGGAKDVNNFRENINNNYLPLPTDITYEGLFYDYYFDTGNSEESSKLFYPSYSCAVTKDPFSGKTEYYLSVGLNSGLKEDEFERKKLNLVIVLDVSGSMSSPFDEYYYDRAGHKKSLHFTEKNIQKMEVAKDSICSILDNLNSGDRLGIVLFNERAHLLQPMGRVNSGEIDDVIDQVHKIRADGSTNLASGMKMATEMVSKYRGANPDEYENRIIFITDAMPNTGEIGEWSLLNTLNRNANDRIYTTVIGIGVDFNTELIEYITKVRGANYYSIHTPGEFAERVSNFDHMVTPLVFNLKLALNAKGCDIEKVYGSPEADKSRGDLMKVNTLFPSDRQEEETKGGLILLKLKKQGKGDGEMKLTVTYEDRSGRTDSSESTIYFEKSGSQYYDNTGIRKGILLSRYADLIKNWIIDEREHMNRTDSWQARVNSDCGIIVPVMYQSTWERQSLPLVVSAQYRSLFREFSKYVDAEINEIGDGTLDQELDVIDLLAKSYKGRAE